MKTSPAVFESFNSFKYITMNTLVTKETRAMGNWWLVKLPMLFRVFFLGLEDHLELSHFCIYGMWVEVGWYIAAKSGMFVSGPWELLRRLNKTFNTFVNIDEM